jgi:hypothetical protein
MPQWGANTNDESKPKNLTEEEKSRTFATTKGWEINRVDGTTEVIVAIRNLSGGNSLSDKLGAADISAVYFLSSSYTTGATGRVRVVWNENITPTTTGTLVVKQTNATSNAVTNITATRAGNTTSNFIDYTFAVGNTTAFSYTIGAQTITQGIHDAGNVAMSSDVTIATSNVVYAVAAASGSTGVTVTAS